MPWLEVPEVEKLDIDTRRRTDGRDAFSFSF